MNVLVIDKTALDEKKGGMARAISTLIESLSDKNIGVVRFIPGPWDLHSLKKENANGIVEYSMAFPLPFGSGSIIKGIGAWIIHFPKTVFQLKKIIDNESIDIIHTTFHSENICIWVCSCLWKIKYVVTLHGSESFLLNKIPFWHRWLAKIVVRGADAVIPVSDGVEQAAQKNFGYSITFERIYNGLKLDGMIESLESTQLPTQLPDNYVVSVGALTPTKGHDVLLYAWAKTIKHFPYVKLVLIGDGPNRIKYEKICRKLNIEESVLFLGWLNHLEVLATVSKSTLHVLPSRSEGFGLVLLEAGALKVANIASNVGGIPEIINGEELGLLVPSDDPNALAQAISNLLGDSERRGQIAQNFYNYILQSFSADTMAGHHVKLYEQLLAKNK